MLSLLQSTPYNYVTTKKSILLSIPSISVDTSFSATFIAHDKFNNQVKLNKDSPLCSIFSSLNQNI